MASTIRKSPIGQVTTETAKIIYIDVETRIEGGIDPEATEYIIRLNGRIIKRIHPFNARRTYQLFDDNLDI